MSIEWDEIKQNIVDRLDIVDAYSDLGMPINRTGSSDWLRAVNDDAFAVNIRSGAFKDHRDPNNKGSFWSYALEHGSFDGYLDCLKYYAEKAGIELPLKPDPAKDLEWLDDLDDDTLTKYCKLKRISVDVAKREGAKIAKYKKKTIVVVFPVYAEYFGIEPCGYVVVRPDGRPLFKSVTKQMTRGSCSGVIGRHAYQRLTEQRTADRPQTAIKCEGLTDFLRMAAEIPEEAQETTFAFSNSSGCSESPADWIRIALFGASVFIVGDCDKPGQAGATKWAGLLAHRSTVKMVKLPYAVTDSKGKDLCDYFGDGHTYEDFLGLPQYDVEPAEEEDEYVRPEPFRNYVEWYNDETDRNEKRPKSNKDVVVDLVKRTNGWPKVCQGTLFFEEGGRVIESPNVDHFFFRLQQMLGLVDWVSGSAFVTKRELFHGLPDCVERFDAIETLPHYPPLSNVYYTGSQLTLGDGSYLDKLLTFFNTATTNDRELLRAAFATPLWGGPPGARPAFFFTTADGPGVGKTKTAEAIGYLYGGAIALEKTSSIADVKTRILSDKAQGKRVALLDNIKAAGWSWGDFEALLSARNISGRALYVGEGTRPNMLTYLLTGNGISLGTDISQRVIEIRLSKPRYADFKKWVSTLFSFIDENRAAILSDLVTMLAADPQDMGTDASRWSDWEVDVLSKCGNPWDLYADITKRQKEADSEQDTAYDLHEVFRRRLESYTYDPQTERILIPSHVANRWYVEATNERVTVTRSTQQIKLLCGRGQMPNLAYRRDKSIRGFIWEGDGSDSTKPVRDDLAERVEIREDMRRFKG
jgi:hypothetical protein